MCNGNSDGHKRRITNGERLSDSGILGRRLLWLNSPEFRHALRFSEFWRIQLRVDGELLS